MHGAGVADRSGKHRAEVQSRSEEDGQIPGDLREVLVTAREIVPQWHVTMQAALQANIDNAVSKRVNLPTDATVEDVDRVFRLAYDRRCKGIAFYRDNSQSEQILSAAEGPAQLRQTQYGPRPASSAWSVGPYS
jgi:ribonucleoside-diphosphate reductase alpha chain